ncbi:type II toxin-antitoxin system death-on-curing family toxin [Devosia sediminis]|uniref:Type II toxin-antitoxin system death-on-curing family toxin n=1 Tax=Devosia sediminis TaxID=2798801 RepID=A0A934J098_9HYPH|nr:type II toxin-antitoxin system death-on-curing family toxin [Devosia sediminis]MBJ3785234.1 type II toxin-antitoxin system death-on-curing family toxin [Devosia sediminis]
MASSYLTLNEALRIHEILIDAFGGATGVRDLGLIEAALLRPQTGYYSDLVEEAAALWESLAMNHGFVDGNKRVAYACLELFLQLNGFDIAADNDQIERFIYANLEAGTFRKDVLENWLRQNTVPLSH